MQLNIIATGYSLKDVDLSKIERPIMAINYACNYVDYDYLAAFDDPVKYNFPIDDRLHTNIEYVRKYNLDCHGWSRKARRDKLVIDSSIEIFGRSGSLFCGINVALKLGFKELHIYGADMKLTDGYCHFYDKEEVLDKKHLWQYERSFKSHKKTKNLIMRQILYTDIEIIWH